MRFPYVVMKNILGRRKGKASEAGIEEVEKQEGVFVHMYGKLKTRPQRKMGHINVVGDNLEELLKLAQKVREQINI